MLPTSALGTRDTIEQKALIVQAIQAHLLGSVTIEAVSAWALKAFHSIHSDDQDVSEEPEALEAEDDHDDDEDESLTGDDAMIEHILDMLMFADSPDFAPSRAALMEAVTELRR